METVDNNEASAVETKDIYSNEITQGEYETLRSGGKLEATSEEDQGQKEEKESEPVEGEKVEESDPQEEETDADEAKDSEGDEEESEDDESEEKEEPKRGKRKSGFKRRIDKLNQRVSDRDLRIQQLERDLELTREKQEKETETEKVAKPLLEDGKPVRPKEDDFETYEAFDDAREKYFEDLADWKVDLRLQKEETAKKQSAQKTAYQNTLQAHTDRVNEFKKENTDFEDVILDCMEDNSPSAAFETAVLDSEISAELVYELAKDPDEYDRINALEPMKLAKAIGRIEARLLAKKPTEPKKAVEKTKAPRPLGKVGTRGAGSAKNIYEAHKMSQREYEALRAEQLKK